MALASFSGQRITHADAAARSSATAAVSQIESCYAFRQDYRQCVSPTVLSAGGGSVGDGPGRVNASAQSPTSYRLVATSASPGPAGVAHAQFTIAKDSTGSTRTCNRPGVGGCDPTGRW